MHVLLVETTVVEYHRGVLVLYYSRWLSMGTQYLLQVHFYNCAPQHATQIYIFVALPFFCCTGNHFFIFSANPILLSLLRFIHAGCVQSQIPVAGARQRAVISHTGWNGIRIGNERKRGGRGPDVCSCRIPCPRPQHLIHAGWKWNWWSQWWCEFQCRGTSTLSVAYRARTWRARGDCDGPKDVRVLPCRCRFWIRVRHHLGNPGPRAVWMCFCLQSHA